MELGLSLGDASKPQQKGRTGIKKRGSCMALGINSQKLDEENDDEISEGDGSDDETALQLNLLPIRISSHLHSLPWSSDNGSSENGSSGNMGPATAKTAEVSSANSVGSMDLGIYLRNVVGNDVVVAERESSRDDDENALNHRKKLRLSKQQSASLEESFKQNNTLNPKEKVALAKRLNLRARQVEVWFQNRRARTKLKQTEVDCDYLKRCCDTLTEENRRLHKELQELRALKSSNPFCMPLPATTLTMCPSCERVATTAAPLPFSENRHRFFPFCQIPGRPNQPNQSFSNICD